MTPGATTELAAFVAGSRIEDLPAAVRREATRTLVNFLGCALGGCRDAALEHAVAVLKPFAGPPQAGVLGRDERLDLLTAAFLNAAAANVHDFDDTHLPTVIHPAAPVVPAALALAEDRGASGAAFLHAVVLGIEVACRVGNSVTPWHYAHGWHITSTCGAIGAAAATGKLLGLDAPRMAMALGIAANQSCGLIEALGTMAKSASVGSAPRSGLLAAMLAERGFTAAPAMLEGTRGFVHVMGENPDVSRITDGLGTAWESARNTYKPWPCGIVLHPVIDALLALRGREAFDAQEVVRVVVTGHPLLRQRTDRPGPASGREAQVSLQHTVAACLVRGAAGLAEYSDAAAADPGLRAFGRRLEIVDDASLAVESARVAVHLPGRVLEHAVDRPLGSLANPMSDAQLEKKARALAAFGGSGWNVDGLLAAAWAIEGAPQVRLTRAGARN